MTLPNFLIIGEMKCGTSALYYQLKQHPDVFMEIKEIHYFTLGIDNDGFGRATTLSEYQALFAGAQGERAIGEDSPSYLAHPHGAERIHALLPDVRLVAVLRDPVERAYSHFWHERMRVSHSEPISDFLTAFHAYDHRWSSYKNRGFYHRNLQRYQQRFDFAGQMHFIIYDDYKRDPAGVIRALYDYLEVDSSFQPVQEWYWKTGVPKNRRLLDLLRSRSIFGALAKAILPENVRKRIKIRVYNSNLEAPPPLDPQIRADLIALYRDDILRLEDMTQRDLTHWLR